MVSKSDEADVLVSDNGILCKRDFPDAYVIVDAQEVMDLPRGTKVGGVFYRVGKHQLCPRTVLWVLVALGVLEEVGLEKPIEG